MNNLRNYRHTLIKLAKLELDRATLHAPDTYMRECHIRSADAYVMSARRVTTRIHNQRAAHT